MAVVIVVEDFKIVGVVAAVDVIVVVVVVVVAVSAAAAVIVLYIFQVLELTWSIAKKPKEV